MICPNCSSPDAECIIGNYWKCSKFGCRFSVAKKVVDITPEEAMDALANDELTDPGWGPLVGGLYADYQCLDCKVFWYMSRSAVANGAVCAACGGVVHVCPSKNP